MRPKEAQYLVHLSGVSNRLNTLFPRSPFFFGIHHFWKGSEMGTVESVKRALQRQFLGCLGGSPCHFKYLNSADPPIEIEWRTKEVRLFYLIMESKSSTFDLLWDQVLIIPLKELELAHPEQVSACFYSADKTKHPPRLHYIRSRRFQSRNFLGTSKEKVCRLKRFLDSRNCEIKVDILPQGSDSVALQKERKKKPESIFCCTLKPAIIRWRRCEKINGEIMELRLAVD